VSTGNLNDLSVFSGGGTPMSAVQSFLFGIMVAWTPSLVVLVWLLRSAPNLGSHDQQNSLDY